MFLESVSILNYRNLAELSLELSPRVNIFTGNNGVGKTNFLDCVYYLSFCKSFSNYSDALNINYNKDFFLLEGKYNFENTTDKITCSLKRGQKKTFKRNKTVYKKLSEHIGLIPLVIISPGDSILITGGSEERRKLIDGVISQFDKAYLNNLMNYNRVLSQRNKLLRQFAANNNFNSEIIEIYNQQLIEKGTEIYEKRKLFLNELTPVFRKYYELISGGKEEVSITYASKLNDTDFETLLKENLEKDKLLTYTSKGPHRDDINLKLNKHSIKKVGSQGQQKSFLLALKLAQYAYINQKTHLKPILLLDDIFDKLDAERVKNLIKTVGLDETPGKDNFFGQIFITDTNKTRVSRILDEHSFEYKIFEMDNLTEEDEAK